MGIGTHLNHFNTVPLSIPSCHSNYLYISSVESIKTFNWICIYVFDIASDAIVGFKTLNGLSSRLGIFILVLVFVTLVHENVRSTLLTYQADRELLRIHLGKFDLKREDYKSDKTMLNYHYDIKGSYKRYLARFVWPFRIHGHSSSLEKFRSILFNILSLLMLRPIVDRLIFLTHPATNLRVIYRQKAKQVFLNQYYMITEQIPELLIQFYIFQIYFNLLSEAEDYQLTGCMGKHSFTYRREYFECVEDISRLKICASWLEIFSMLVPFCKIPHTLVSLENMCRILHPLSQEMSAEASGFLYIAYILMIPSRLFLLSALMHAAPDHLSVVYYFLVITVCIMLYNLKRANTQLPRSFASVWSILLFSIRDMMVISLRRTDAYLLSPSKMTHESLRSWKEVFIISIFHFILGLLGAVYVEKNYPCGLNAHLLKYQGWIYVTLFIVSSGIVTLISFTCQPLQNVSIPWQYPSRSAIVFVNGIVMWLITVSTFFATRTSDRVDETTVLVVAAISLAAITSLAAALLILGYFGEAKSKTKKQKTKDHKHGFCCCVTSQSIICGCMCSQNYKERVERV